MMDLFNSNQKGAVFSDCRMYRYVLWRIWDESKPKAMCVGLNPSTANSENDDPTIYNLKKILNHLGYGGLYMTNLYAFISSHPKDLLTCKDPIGENDLHLQKTRLLCNDVILCFGNFKEATERAQIVTEIFPNSKCFGTNKNGTPFHPLALMYNGTVNNPKLLDYFAIKTTE